ncbi:MAG: hypothetical protein CUN53_08750 [Phototrophicales bacterium]|nr:MAG: hypothetical protein CUN53_08750 [Phototrophicales bacterium]
MEELALHQELIAALKAQLEPVRAEDAMAEAGRKIMLREFIAMLKHEAGSRIGTDIEDVHDMRVAIRRMRSALRLLGDYYKPKAIRAYNRKLRRVARALGAVRDLDVMIEAFANYATPTEGDMPPAAERVIAAMDKERDLARMELNHALDRGEYRRFVNDFSQFLTTEGAGARLHNDDLTPSQVRHVLPTLIYTHIGAVRAFDAVIDDAIEQNDQVTLHNLRIEFKRLRYAVSMFEDVLGAPADGFINELKKIQDHLGELQDSYIAVQRLSDFLDEVDEEAAAYLQAYIDQLTPNAEDKRKRFAEVWKRFNSKTVQGMIARAVAAL